MKEFHKAYVEMKGKADAFAEVYNMLEQAAQTAQIIAKQIKEPEKNYAI